MIVLVVHLRDRASLSVAYIALTNRIMFKMGLRNLPRRGLQTGLVVVGLMLATLITTAAFTTGDTVDYSITKAVYDTLQRTDLSLNFVGGEDVGHQRRRPSTSTEARPPALEREFADDPDIDGFLPFLHEPVPAINQRTSLSEPAHHPHRHRPGRGSARSAACASSSGGKADLATLGANDIFLSKRAADKLDAQTGDTLTIYVERRRRPSVTVTGIVKDELAPAARSAFDQQAAGGGAMLLSSVQQLTGHDGQINRITVALKGDVATSYKRTDAAVSRLEPFVQSAEGQQLLGIANAPSPSTRSSRTRSKKPRRPATSSRPSSWCSASSRSPPASCSSS